MGAARQFAVPRGALAGPGGCVHGRPGRSAGRTRMQGGCKTTAVGAAASSGQPSGRPEETAMDTTTAPIDTSIMPTIHTVFRREFRLAGGVIRRVADGDVRRATVVAEHLDLVAPDAARAPHRRGRTALAEAARAGARGAGADRAAHGGAARAGRRPAHRDRRTPPAAGRHAPSRRTATGWPTCSTSSTSTSPSTWTPRRSGCCRSPPARSPRPSGRRWASGPARTARRSELASSWA